MTFQEHPEEERRQELWRDTVARFERFSGLVAEIDDPLTWGLDLTEETVAGGSESDPTEERFLRSYWSPWRDLVDLETLHCRVERAEQAEEITRMALCSALAAPHHPLDVETNDFLDSYAEYRVAMREIVAATEAAPAMRCRFVVDGVRRPALCMSTRSATAVYTTVAERGLVLAGPDDLIDQLTIVMRPIHNLLGGESEAQS
jgi:hypothetical protein